MIVRRSIRLLFLVGHPPLSVRDNLLYEEGVTATFSDKLDMTYFEANIQQAIGYVLISKQLLNYSMANRSFLQICRTGYGKIVEDALRSNPQLTQSWFFNVDTASIGGNDIKENTVGKNLYVLVTI